MVILTVTIRLVPITTDQIQGNLRSRDASSVINKLEVGGPGSGWVGD